MSVAPMSAKRPSKAVMPADFSWYLIENAYTCAPDAKHPLPRAFAVADT